jgi:hypothetical protein
MRFFFLVLFLLSVEWCQAQYQWTEAYISLNNGDILVGQAKLTQQGEMYNFNLSQKLKFRIDKESKTQKFRAKEVKEVMFTVYKHDFTDGNISMSSEDLLFVPVTTSMKRKNNLIILMQEIVTGSVSLYRRTNIESSPVNYINSSNSVTGMPIAVGSTYWEESEFWLGKPDEAAVKIDDGNIFKNLNKQLSAYFADCPYVIEVIESRDVKIEELEDIVFDYNVECGL